ncbi:SIMPL domain-containing protein [Patescibacteria group bacterium]|nr:SIMPL domain-containing protein [Patescibacteria group bacterium]
MLEETKKDYKKNVMEVLTLLLLITSVFMVFKTVGEFKSLKYVGQTGVNTMSFSGEGEVFAVADVASFSFSVIEEAKTPKEAQELSATKINAAVEYLKEQGVEDKDIKTTNYNVSPRYEWKSEQVCASGVWCPPSEEKRTLVGYEASQSISVKIKDTEKAGDILSGIGEIGVTNISSLSFSIDDEDELNREARKLAIEDAEEKARILSKDLGVKLVRIVSFNESGVYQRYNTKTLMDVSTASGMGGEMISPELPLGENKITSNVTITYEIR